MSVELMLPLSGAEGGTIFKDYSTRGATVTVTGNVKTTAAQAKHYGSSALFDGDGDRLSVPIILFPSASDFTIEAWVRIDDCADGFYVMSQSNSATSTGGMAFFVGTDKKLSFLTGTTTTKGGDDVPSATWQHLCLMQSASRIYGLLHGVPQFDVARENVAFNNGSSLNVGATWNGAGTFSPGYMNDLRIDVGAANYPVTGFTPPSYPLFNTTDPATAQTPMMAIERIGHGIPPVTAPLNMAWDLPNALVERRYSGPGTIQGVFKKKSVNSEGDVYILTFKTGQRVARTRADASGNWRVDGLALGVDYIALGVDDLKQLDPDGLSPLRAVQEVIP